MSQKSDANIYYVGCSECDEIFHVNADECEEDDVWICPECNEPTSCAWYGCCPACEEFSSFRHGSFVDTAAYIMAKSVQGFLNPIQAVVEMKRFVDNIPDGTDWGFCTLCDTECVVCPTCQTIQVWLSHQDSSRDFIRCCHCRTRYRHP
jgi:hypothetical protein